MNIIIDSHRIAASSDDTIYQAAKKAGIVIPSLCASDHLNPFGSCRLCLCEIEGQSGTPAACTTPVREGLVVQTDTTRLQRLRRNMVELYRIGGPNNTNYDNTRLKVGTVPDEGLKERASRSDFS